MTSQEILAVFRLTIPAMADVSDVEILSDIEIYGVYLSKRAFGVLYPKALSYFIAHMRTLNDMILARGADDPSFNTGSLTSEKEGDLERGYAALSASASNEGNALLMKTAYGQLFLQLRRMAIIPATIRSGCYGCYR